MAEEEGAAAAEVHRQLVAMGAVEVPTN